MKPSRPTGSRRESLCEKGEGRLSLDHSALARQTSLDLRDGLALDEWQRIGLQIFRISDSSTWWLGDWLDYGSRHYPDRYRRAIEETGLDYQTLRNYAWVARKFPPRRRRAALSFHHHMEVAALPEHEQDAWLREAESRGWSRNQLRQQIRKPSARPAESAVVQVRVGIPPDQLQRWEEAAGRAQRDLLGWILDILNEAARSTVALTEAVQPARPVPLE
ncbi:hypothetical protein GCM10010149_12770 [Nonomuraea roseoviolacea subsp. roseoviolacea]|uniref:LmbU n=1 Tax=Nonomuraea roseoviolacea subsp. carminata TaxID=160689 RepID=A0ABT1KC02_9ACTN|nr:LmbU family transcriptional regulator [Nonomuraea roseoviolacea]MCP2351222.1 hypothetical protein [Nonomuraea roseoviolacea subsp. carminata]